MDKQKSDPNEIDIILKRLYRFVRPIEKKEITWKGFYAIYDPSQNRKFRLCYLVKMLDKTKNLMGRVVYFEEVQLCDSVHFIPLVEGDCDLNYAFAKINGEVVKVFSKNEIGIDTPKELQVLVLLRAIVWRNIGDFVKKFEEENSWLKMRE